MCCMSGENILLTFNVQCGIFSTNILAKIDVASAENKIVPALASLQVHRPRLQGRKSR